MNVLPARLRPFAKAIYPFVASVVAVAVQWACTGSYDHAELATSLTGLAGAALTFFVPNAKD